MKNKIIISVLVIMGIMLACKKTELEKTGTYSDVPALPETPYSYEHTPNSSLVALGRVLFYDKKLSLNNSVSCGSCHQQSKAFCDNQQFSTGLENAKTQRNTPSIFAKSGRMFWDGRASDVNNLVLKPVKNHVEMKFEDVGALATKLSKISYYPGLFNSAFGFDGIDSTKIQQALSAFIQNFTFSNNKFAQSNGNDNKLSATEKNGKLLFFGKAKCSNCHHVEGFASSNGYGFTDQAFNIGLDEVYTDNGMGSLTNVSEDNGKFMIPSLLNVEYTAPYMHDGRFKTLEEVVEHYNSGVKNHPNLDASLRETTDLSNFTEAEILALLDKDHNGFVDQSEMAGIAPQRLNLSTTEKRDLVSFLKTLTDGSILVDKRFSDPFKH